MLGNMYAGNKGRTVRALGGRTLRRAADFPGWGAANYADYLLPVPAGLAGTVTNVESHGANPYTRYSVEFTDGSRASGLVTGTDIEFTS